MVGAREERLELREQRPGGGLVGEDEARRIAPIGVQVDGKRNLRVRRVLLRLDRRDGIGDHRVDRHVGIRDAVHEGSVRAILEEAAHEVRQQVLVAAHRRIHAARATHRDDLLV